MVVSHLPNTFLCCSLHFPLQLAWWGVAFWGVVFYGMFGGKSKKEEPAAAA